MGQKVSPTGFRLGVTEDWRSRWYADKNYAENLHNDLAIRKFLDKELAHSAVSRVEIERAGDKIKIVITTARPGIVIGKKGAEIDNLRKKLGKVANGKVSIEVIEVKRPELDANLVAQSVAEQLEGRVAFRRAMRKAVQSARKSGCEGIRIQCSGRLGGAEMCRREWYAEGRVPRHTLRAKIDYGFATAATTMGSIGVQVWIYHGEVLPGQKAPQPQLEGTSRANRPRRDRRDRGDRNDRNERGAK
jgi:small subunit ribosomal protein S3